MSNRHIAGAVKGIVFFIFMMLIAAGSVYVFQEYMIPKEEEVQTLEDYVHEVDPKYKDKIGTQGYRLMMVEKDDKRQQYYVDKVCIATGEIVASYWEDYKDVDFKAIID